MELEEAEAELLRLRRQEVDVIYDNMTADERRKKKQEIHDSKAKVMAKIDKLRMQRYAARRKFDITFSNQQNEEITFEDGVKRICYQSYDRSSTLLLCYLIQNGANLMTAYYELLSKKPNLLLNKGFRRQLVQFDAVHQWDEANEL